MRKFYLLAALNMCYSYLIAQDRDNPWSIEAGVNYVNVYPVGEESLQGEFFDEYFNSNDHWNLGTYFAVTRDFGRRLSLTAKGSFNEISKWGETGNDASLYVDNLKYYGLDGMINFKLLTTTKLKPYIAIGGGYTWIEEGPYNTFSLKNGSGNLVGAGTVNGALGVTFEITNRFGLNLQFAYKHAFKEYLTKHFQNSVGVYYHLGKSPLKEESNEVKDTDGDGIDDTHDLCPDLAGRKEFAGCPDTDGDGVPDSIDKCLEQFGEVSNGGCPLPDSDGDGVPDKLDKCPDHVGLLENGGCPKAQVHNEVEGAGDESKQIKAEQVKLNDFANVISFETGNYNFKQECYPILIEIVELLKKHPNAHLIIEGHTDSVGSFKANKTLSKMRANAVKNYLVASGISESNIETIGYGELKPIGSNLTAEGRKSNRRVEIKMKD